MRKIRAFKCNECGKEFEQLVEDGCRPPCPDCKSQDIRFNYTALAIKVNGQGAYTNKMKV